YYKQHARNEHQLSIWVVSHEGESILQPSPNNRKDNPMSPLLRILSAFLVIFAALSVAVAQEKEGKSRDLDSAAKAFIESLDKGEFPTATAKFDDTMRKVMPPDELKRAWQKTLDDHGVFKKQLSSRTGKTDRYEFVIVTCECAKSNI